MEATVLSDAAYLKVQQRKAKRMLLWITIAGMVMMFAGLTSAYIVRQAEGDWTQFDLPVQFAISTIIILISSLTMQLSLKALNKSNKQQFRLFLFTTLGLGLFFVFFQFLGWNEMIKQKLFFVANDPSTSFVYALTGLHLIHLFGGLLALIVCSVKAILDQYSSENNLGIVQCAVYWHFLDALWVYLYLFFLFFR